MTRPALRVGGAFALASAGSDSTACAVAVVGHELLAAIPPELFDRIREATFDL